jgi:hypothetical protein
MFKLLPIEATAKLIIPPCIVLPEYRRGLSPDIALVIHDKRICSGNKCPATVCLQKRTEKGAIFPIPRLKDNVQKSLKPPC